MNDTIRNPSAQVPADDLQQQIDKIKRRALAHGRALSDREAFDRLVAVTQFKQDVER